MNCKYNIWNKWDPLKTVLLGDCYAPSFFKDIKNSKIRSALTQIAEETQEDLAYYEKVLKDFGCQVLRPTLDSNDNILNYINENGEIRGKQGVPRSPLQPRDTQLVIGNEIFYTNFDHDSIKNCLDAYNKNSLYIEAPLSEKMFNGYVGDDAPDWPDYHDYFSAFCSGKPYSVNQQIVEELNEIHKNDKNLKKFFVEAPSITVVGKDIYIDLQYGDTSEKALVEYYLSSFKKLFSDFRINTLKIGGHNDGSFHTIKPGAILSLKNIQAYYNTFPNWDICYLPDQSWSKIEGFLQIKEKVAGKWWVPDQEENDEFTHFVETWLQDWVGYVEETVFDVNVLVLDEYHVCVNKLNPTVVNFLKKHNMEPVLVPWRHRYFWDGGLHCITLDLYRAGKQQDYFPNRLDPITDLGFE